MSDKYPTPKRRNFLVKAMNLKSKPQVFKHKLEPKGGAKNDQPDLLEEVEQDDEQSTEDSDDEDV